MNFAKSVVRPGNYLPHLFFVGNICARNHNLGACLLQRLYSPYLMARSILATLRGSPPVPLGSLRQSRTNLPYYSRPHPPRPIFRPLPTPSPPFPPLLVSPPFP